MPSRILREGILTSKKILSLGWAEEVFYRRLHSVVDDFGRYFADHGLLRSACYPRQLDKVSDSDIGKWLACVQKAALVRVYLASDGERYLEVLNFGQQVRAKKSKFPQPPPIDERTCSACVADDKQMKSNAHLGVVVFEDVSVSEDEKARTPVVRKEGATAIAAALRHCGMKISEMHPEIQRLAEHCVSTEVIVEAHRIAVQDRGKTTPAIGYLLPIIKDLVANRSGGAVGAPSKTMQAIMTLEAMKNGG